jgi:hypothetical protein
LLECALRLASNLSGSERSNAEREIQEMLEAVRMAAPELCDASQKN